MSENTSISWTTHTFNPWWGCTKASSGCANCYAEGQGPRRHVRWGPGLPRRVASDAYWKKPARWNRKAEKTGKPILVFCASKCDVFDEEAPQGQQERLWSAIEATPHLRWQLLTKRPERILETIPLAWRKTAPKNVWYGATVENKDNTWRVRELVKVPAVVRLLSVEPLLGPIPRLPLRGIDWVIVGGESGHKARPMNPDWARQIRDRVVKRGLPFFFKQWGKHDAEGQRHRRKKYLGSDVLDGREWLQYPEMRAAGA